MYNFITQQSIPKKIVIDTQEDEKTILNFTTYTKKNSLGKRIKRGIRVLFTKARPTQTNELGSGLTTIMTSFKNKKIIEVSQLLKHDRCYKRL